MPFLHALYVFTIQSLSAPFVLVSPDQTGPSSRRGASDNVPARTRVWPREATSAPPNTSFYRYAHELSRPDLNLLTGFKAAWLTWFITGQPFYNGKCI